MSYKKDKTEINWEGKGMVLADRYTFENNAQYIVYNGHLCIVFGHNDEGEKMFNYDE